MTSALIRQVCLLKLIQAEKTKDSVWPCVCCTVTVQVTDTPLYSVNALDPSHRQTHPHRANCLKSSFEHGKGKRCHNLSFLSWYQCPISIHPQVYRFSLPVLSNLSQLLWLWLLPKPRQAHCLSQVIFYRIGETDVWRVLIKTHPLWTNQCWQCVCID